MIRKLLIASMVVALAGFGFAQQPMDVVVLSIAPTTGDGADAISKDSNEASVKQDVKLVVPQATALHLDASTLTFDLTNFDGQKWDERAKDGGSPDSNLACVYAKSVDDPRYLDDPRYWGQTQTLPGGTKYDVAGWPNITVTGEQVVNYPPLRLGSDDELMVDSKNHIVCYQSFVIQLFSNWDTWDLTVSRVDDPAKDSIEHLYVQGNTCSDFGVPTGLYALRNDSDPVHLIPNDMVAGTTGDRVNDTDANRYACPNQNTSWLDVLGVVAVKVNADHHGKSFAQLTYTLASADFDASADFE